MKGLFIKDVLLMGKRKQAIAVFIIVLLVMGYAMGGSFLIGYGTMLFGVFSIGTLSYDDFDNCMPFLLSLPVTRRQYVLEKFLFSAAGIGCGWVLSVLVGCIVSAIQGEPMPIVEVTAETVMMLPMSLSLIDIWIPIELKFGIEKSRTVIAVFAGFAFALGFLGSRFFSGETPTILRIIEEAPDGVILAVFLAMSIIILAITFSLSCRILNKKEY